jgi:membrane-bound metal-dependent hydrolase YbcI (DUF457 family)
MITRHHLALAMMCTLIMGSAVYPADIPALGALVAGSCIGVILPDIHITRPGRVSLRMFAWYVSRFSVRVCVPLLCAVYYWSGLNLCPSDKRLTHSIPGILVVGAVATGFLFIPDLFFLNPQVNPLAVTCAAGIAAGLVLHLVEDACTFKGITPFFPFSTIRISGSIRPCDATDFRIARYHVQHCSVAAAVIGYHGIARLTGSLSLAFSLVALISCLAIMVWYSDVRILSGENLAGESRP